MLEKYKALLSMAQTWYSQGQYKQSIEYSLNSLKYDEIALDAHFLLGMCYNRIKDFRNAVEHFESYLMFCSFDIRYKKIVLDNWCGNHVQLFEANYFCAHSYYELQDYNQALIYYRECINKFSFDRKEEIIYSELQFLAKQMEKIIKKDHKIDLDSETPTIFRLKSFACIACRDTPMSKRFNEEFKDRYEVSIVKSPQDLLRENKKSSYIRYHTNIIVDVDFDDQEICDCSKSLNEFDPYTVILVFSNKLKISNSMQCSIDKFYPLIPDFNLIFSDISEISDKKNKKNNDSFLDLINS